MDKIIDTVSIWKQCPPEILLIIFDFLDAKTLVNCMLVNKQWWSIITNTIVKRIGWDKFIEDVLPDRGATFKKRSSLSLHDTVLNICLWQEIYLALPQCSYIHNVNGVLKMNVYRDNIIIVTNRDVKYFDIKSHRLLKCFPMSCINFDENDYMFVKVEKYVTYDAGKFQLLTLYGKEDKDSCGMYEDQKFTQKVLLYRFFENWCYFSISDYCIFVSKWEHKTWQTHLVARYFGFGTISDINVYYNEVLALLNWGGMLQVDHGCVKFRLHNEKRSSLLLELPHYTDNAVLYERNGAIAGVPSDKPFFMKTNGPKYWVLQCPGLSCTLKHGNMILLGYKDGKVEIYNPIKFQNQTTSKMNPQVTFNLKKLTRQAITNPKVLHLDVAEIKGAHILFIGTSTFVYQLTLGYRLNGIY